MAVTRCVCAGVLVASILSYAHVASAEIPKPDDAPKPMSPLESAKSVQLPDGFYLESVASEPLIQQPSGICWDAQGRLFVSELHGYNLEGHYDILELNKTGELDRVVQRIHASEEAKEAARPGTYGTIKRLADSDGDGVLDQAVVFADRLPPCHGICPARDGLIAICTTDILFLADRDGDGKAEVQEVLFQGFSASGLERSINSPQWDPDGWISVSMSGDAGTITGPYLPAPVNLPHSDFRIKADGTAIEPILGVSRTFGAAFTERGERVVVTTAVPAIFAAPIPWRYLSRNPDYAAEGLEIWSGGQRTYPASKPHPWRTRRAEDPGFSKYYTDGYGIVETAPNGYFTSACSPLVYRDTVLPGLHGQIFTCEPAQNMVHRALLSRVEARLHLSRAPEEEKSEFLASKDSWFNPISLVHGPDGCIYIVDFYREIIEDYSAVPRYLQQQYGLTNGNDFGRIWKLTHRDAQPLPVRDMSHLSGAELVEELQSPGLWRRQTARRLLEEQQQVSEAPAIARLVETSDSPEVVINALGTLENLDRLQVETVLAALSSTDAGIRIRALRLGEPWLHSHPEILVRTLEAAKDEDLSVALQAALSLGETSDPRAIAALADLARNSGHVDWIDTAIITSLSGRAGRMLQLLLTDQPLENAGRLLSPLAAAVAARKNPEELSALLTFLPQIEDLSLQRLCWEGLAAGLSGPVLIALSPEASAALKATERHDDPQIAEVGKSLVQRLQIETPEERLARITEALNTVRDIQAKVEDRLAAVSEIAGENDPQVSAGLLTTISESTPQVRDAILTAVFSRQDRLPAVVSALEENTFPVSFLSAVQRSALLTHNQADIRDRASQLFHARDRDIQQLLSKYSAALNQERDLSRGATLYAKHCGTCHQAHGVGHAVGPDLAAEFKRPEETILRDIIDPSGTITAGYGTYTVVSTDGRIISGLLAAESASSITLKQPEGKSQTILRKDVEEIKASNVSLMPENLVEALQPQDVADILAWVRTVKKETASEPK
ncbi:PVC-type heme-binding CxxCH protein [Planctomicrobium sp. SH661]|uniref:PVC-type heme-binding CxxCH protein n=1 Tax=Planctomicrobium sp. SH661 TaxID=3448124 RepID=UPI003F5B6630